MPPCRKSFPATNGWPPTKSSRIGLETLPGAQRLLSELGIRRGHAFTHCGVRGGHGPVLSDLNLRAGRSVDLRACRSTTGRAARDTEAGRRTYEIFAAYWPRVPIDSDNRHIADLFNSVPKHVATHRSDALDWQHSQALAGGLADAIRALKHEAGVNLLTWGSGDMVRQLLAAGLVDELRLMVYPVVLGRGKRLFGETAQPSSFTLAYSISTSNGVLLTRYRRGGEVHTGAFKEAE